jgi:hypothetical protein
MLVKKLDQLREISQRPGQPVDFIDDNDIDLAGCDFAQKCLQGRAIERGAGKRPVVIAVGNKAPAFVRLALDVGLAGLALSVERVELEIEVSRWISGCRSPWRRLGPPSRRRWMARSSRSAICRTKALIAISVVWASMRGASSARPCTLKCEPIASPRQVLPHRVAA